MLKKYLITYGKKKMLGRVEDAFDIVVAHKCKRALKEFDELHPHVPISNVFVELLFPID